MTQSVGTTQAQIMLFLDLSREIESWIIARENTTALRQEWDGLRIRVHAMGKIMIVSESDGRGTT